MRVFGLSVLSAIMLAGCASLEPEPCTADWVEWKTDRITSGFVQEFRPELRDLARFSQRLENNPSPLLLLEMSTRLSDFEGLAASFQDNIIPELKSAVDQCGTPTQFARAFSGILEDQGVSGTVLEWVEDAAIAFEQTQTL